MKSRQHCLLDLANQKGESGKYIYDVDQLRQIKIGLENKQEIEKFTNPELSAYKMSIIRGMDAQDIPLEKNVDEIVKRFLKIWLCWQKNPLNSL